MHLGLVGLGKMGGNMRERMRRAGVTVTGYDRNPEVSDVGSLAELVQALPSPKVVWVMVPAGAPTQATIEELHELLRYSLPSMASATGAWLPAMTDDYIWGETPSEQEE